MLPSTTQPTNGKGSTHDLNKRGVSLGGSILNYGFIGIDSMMRIKEGESAPVAVGKALLTNAAFSMIPGGIVGALGVIGVMSAPEIMNQLDRSAGSINAKKQQFGGSYQGSEAQMMQLQQGLSNMQQAQQQAMRKVTNHARNAQRVY